MGIMSLIEWNEIVAYAKSKCKDFDFIKCKTYTTCSSLWYGFEYIIKDSEGNVFETIKTGYPNTKDEYKNLIDMTFKDVMEVING